MQNMNAPRPLRSARSKAETLAWFLARPAMHKELFRRVVSLRVATTKSEADRNYARSEAQRWCETVSVDVEDACRAAGLPVPLVPVPSLYPEVWRSAESRAGEEAIHLGGPAQADFLHHLCRHRPMKTVVETGVAAGWSSLAILLALQERGSGELFSVDMPYPRRDNEHSVGCVVADDLRGRWHLFREPDRDALPKILRQRRPVDLVHHDSDKTYKGRMFVYGKAWEALMPSGLLMSDDVEDNAAFRDFANSVGRPPTVFAKSPGNYAGFIIR